LITFLGDELSRTHKPFDYLENLGRLKLTSATASVDLGNMLETVEHAKELNFVKDSKKSSLNLTMQGWGEYERLKRGNLDSKTAFMAMQFSNEKLQKFYESYIRKAVLETGYTIEKVDENPEKDENINTDIKLKIRDSKFVIVDLSDSNNGAYWEAGYAEGLGKKVIYIFYKLEWNKVGTDEDKKCKECGKNLINKPHFDVDRNRILHWDDTDLADKFCDKLKSTIRYYFP
jgi:nucleoside 2-deoxyribosyltransferase